MTRKLIKLSTLIQSQVILPKLYGYNKLFEYPSIRGLCLGQATECRNVRLSFSHWIVYLFQSIAAQGILKVNGGSFLTKTTSFPLVKNNSWMFDWNIPLVLLQHKVWCNRMDTTRVWNDHLSRLVLFSSALRLLSHLFLLIKVALQKLSLSRQPSTASRATPSVRQESTLHNTEERTASDERPLTPEPARLQDRPDYDSLASSTMLDVRYFY